MKRLIALLLLIPLLDILLLLVVSTVIGEVATVLLVVLTALLGMLLVRAEGRHTLRRINRKVASGGVPDDELLDGALLIAAGAFFLTPGLVTDLTGLVLSLPPTRYPVRKLVKRFVVTPYLDGKTDGFVTGTVYTGGFPNSNDGSTIDLGEDDYSVEGDNGSD
ncbi:FxsA family protein [Halocatena halophila]|uniref:FxsA family protein n=1 Tax=Halocatena halophila TaxID=2814576 RepID=UPI002ED1338B